MIRRIPKFETPYDYGYKGKAETVRALALLLASTDSETALLRGCLIAHKEGHRSNLQAFFAGYMTAKLQGTAVPGDKILQDLFLNPVRTLLAAEANPAQELKSLLSGMTEKNRQESLDLLLRYSCMAGDIKTARAALEVGADAAAKKNRAVIGAASHVKDEKTKKELLELLYIWGADLDKACGPLVREHIYLVSLQREFNAQGMTRKKKPAAHPRPRL